MAGKLYIAPEDLKDRYSRGMRQIKAYLTSVNRSRGVAITSDRKDNGTVEFVISGDNLSTDKVKMVKQDIQGELCSHEAAPKYDQPPKHLPSGHIKNVAVTKEARKAMEVEDQAQLQATGGGRGGVLTLEALEAHDAKSGPCALRQFACPKCLHSWWRTVLKSKPVSRCNQNCRATRYDALPRSKEFGIGRFKCPNRQCGRKFFAHCEATDRLECRKCGSSAKPYIHPKWRKRGRKSQLNPRANSFNPQYRRGSGRRTREEEPGPHFEPVAPLPYQPGYQPGYTPYDTDSSSSTPYDTDSSPSNLPRNRPRQPKQPRIRSRRRPRIFNPSEVHVSTGSTVSTFLSQVDFENEGEGEGVDLDYDNEDDDEVTSPCRFECFECDNKYTVVCRIIDTAKCFECQEVNRPMGRAAPGEIEVKSNAEHQCSRCEGRGNCPNLM